MPALKKPTAILESSGSFKKNPDRKREDAEVRMGLGSPPKYYDEEKRLLWAEFKRRCPRNILSESDYFAVEIFIPILDKIRKGESLSSPELLHTRSVFSKFGMTPSDRSNVSSVEKEEKEDDIFDQISSGSMN